jgi:hypothetical protein
MKSKVSQSLSSCIYSSFNRTVLISDLKFQISNFKFQISNFKSQISNGKIQIVSGAFSHPLSARKIQVPKGSLAPNPFAIALLGLVSRNAQPAPQGQLQSSHFALIGFVIVAQQMEEAVQNKPAELIQGRVSFLTGISLGHLDGNHNIAKEVLELPRRVFLDAPVFRPGSSTFASCSPSKQPLLSIPRK